MPHRNTILQALRKMLRFKTTLSLYREFYRQIGQPKLYKPFQRGVLEWNDVYPYLYLQAAFTGLQESRLIKHLVIDEMQDYTPIQYAVLNRLFPCPKTILGDFGQSIDPNRQYTLEQLHGLYPGSQLVRLEKSYRSTWEIIHFAKQLVRQADFEAVERHGEEPAVFAAATEEEELARLCQIVEEFHQSEYNALGIVTRTNGEAQALYEQLTSRGAQVSLVTPESRSFHNGALVLSVQMSKGLEFDQVAVPHVNAGTYHTPFDRNLLYVACTVPCTAWPSPTPASPPPCCRERQRKGKREEVKGESPWRCPPPSRLPARSVRGRAPLALAHPLHAYTFQKKGSCAGAGGGDYSIHLISKGTAPPLKPLFAVGQGLSMPLGGRGRSPLKNTFLEKNSPSRTGKPLSPAHSLTGGGRGWASP